MSLYTNPIEQRFTDEMRRAGFTVNQFTFLNGHTLPTVYGSHIAVRSKTSLPVAWKPMGNGDIIYPLTETDAESGSRT